jgi:hypothetical protein
VAGFQDTRDYFTELFTEYNDRLVEGLLALIYRGGVKAKEVEALVDEIYSDLDMSSKIYDNIWDLITTKVKPVYRKVADAEDEEELNALLLAFLSSWDSFGKRLPNRIRNSRRIIKADLYKTAKNAVRGGKGLLDDPEDAKGPYGLSKTEKKEYDRARKRGEAQGRAYVEGAVREKVQTNAEKRNVKTNRYYVDRVGETEALTIRMELELENAKEGSSKVKYITIFVKPDACQVCESFRGQKYTTRTVPHLLAHPNCRCDYVVHYESGDVLTIRGSGQLALTQG